MNIRTVLNTFYYICGLIAAVSMLGIVCIVSAQILARFFYTNIPSSDDISGYLVAWTTFMGLAYAMHHGNHIQVDMFIKLVNPKIRRFITVPVTIIAVIFMGLFSYNVFLFVKESYDYGDFTSGQIPIPLWWVQSPFLFGIIALEISVLDILITQLTGKKREI